MDNFNPQIPDSLSSSPVSRVKNFFSGPKAIFAILGIVLLIELVYAAVVLSTPPAVAPPSSPKPVIAKTPGRMSLFAPKRNLNASEEVRVSVVIGTGGKSVDGADLIVSYDPKILEATSGGLVKGKIFDEYPLLSLDEKKGLISISGINSVKKGFAGTGQFASLVFKAKSSGKANLKIQFEKDSTTDSNLVESSSSKDILEVVDNLELQIN